MFNQEKTIHCVGIGGVGVGAIAELLLRQGYRVTGSDVNANQLVTYLTNLGANIYPEHAAKNISMADVVVYSTAIDNKNPELLAAYEKKLDVCHRSEMLARIMAPFKKITIAGTHGKTTTSSMMANLLMVNGYDPSFAIGGLVHATQSNAYLGQGEWFVAEADESDASFLHLDSDVAIVTNIDEDHMATYQHRRDLLLAAFLEYLNKLPADGLAVVCGDDANIQTILPQVKARCLTYGESNGVDWRLLNFHQDGLISHFVVERQGLPPLSLSLRIPGKHNALNAIATAIVAHEKGLSDEEIQKGLLSFSGVGRRFQSHGELPLSVGGHASILEDYGHHPREIEVIIDALRACWPDRRLVMVFQPHRYSRTQDLLEAFADILSRVDLLVLTPIYGAGEAAIPHITSERLAEMIASRSTEVLTVLFEDQGLQQIKARLKDQDIVIFQGAGSIGQWARKIFKL